MPGGNDGMTGMATVLHRFLLVLGLCLAVSAPAAACSIVYGSNWAFVSAPPEGWESACADEAMKGTSITLWPAEQGASNARAYIYVTVSEKDPAGLEAFAADEQADFRKESPEATVTPEDAGPEPHQFKYVLVHYANTANDREELVAYMDGPNVYYIIVLTADSKAMFDKYRPSFQQYLDGFIPMDRK
jgi:hypothetical protein